MFMRIVENPFKNFIENQEVKFSFVFNCIIYIYIYIYMMKIKNIYIYIYIFGYLIAYYRG